MDIREILTAIQSQCNGHADEFSQRVWNLAEQGLAAFTPAEPTSPQPTQSVVDRGELQESGANGTGPCTPAEPPQQETWADSICQNDRDCQCSSCRRIEMLQGVADRTLRKIALKYGSTTKRDFRVIEIVMDEMRDNALDRPARGAADAAVGSASESTGALNPAVAAALDRIGNIINDAPYRLEERDGAWQAFLQNRAIIEGAE